MKKKVNVICRQGVCPLCGGAIEYGARDDFDNYYPWECPQCGATGMEGYDEVFDGNHYYVRDADGNEIEFCHDSEPDNPAQNSKDCSAEISELYYLKSLCSKCVKTTCGFNHDGICKYSMVHGEKPKYDGAGCSNYTHQSMA